MATLMLCCVRLQNFTHEHVMHNICAPDTICGINRGLSIAAVRQNQTVYYYFNSKGEAEITFRVEFEIPVL